jgi:hypothetical protein
VMTGAAVIVVPDRVDGAKETHESARAKAVTASRLAAMGAGHRGVLVAPFLRPSRTL